MQSQMFCSDINTVARFLANEQVVDLQSHDPVDCVVLCFSSVLFQAERFFRILESYPTLTKTLVLCGGIGHSSQFIWEAVACHERFSGLGKRIHGLPEARVLERILHEFYDVEKIRSAGCRIIVEDKSTNCGSNAIETRGVLREVSSESPASCIIVQDPTMSLRTLASFTKAYEQDEHKPHLVTCPLHVPSMKGDWPELDYDIAGVPSASCWEKKRFYELLLGEIPRLRDDGNGYGPKGRAFISHVEVPPEVEESWSRLKAVLKVDR